MQHVSTSASFCTASAPRSSPTGDLLAQVRGAELEEHGALAVIRLLQRYGTSPTPLAVATLWLQRAIAAAPEDARLLTLQQEAEALLRIEGT